ncbi:YceI family protein [Hymenobacter sp. HDW8]|uniref:YceI family protein n=1 Tax=Hymenobacter sp. HDW8 TaxID=2714932 RepID=UPI001407B59C|nr:YceI family protein [Hymenobacter sp. HDW8]QIL76315.1 YceI family protein [Hymenobacter sp. HDW8]
MKNLTWWSLLIVMLCVAPDTWAQKYMTRTGTVTFYSTSIIEDIEARTEQVSAVVDVQSSQLAFAIPIKSFQFKRTLMQEHFNENYMESERFPKATFSGRVVDLHPDALFKGGSQRVNVEGDLTIHGVTKRITVPGALEMSRGTLLVHAYFNVAPADYGIEVPLLVRENIAKTVGIRVSLSCDPVSQLTLSK